MQLFFVTHYKGVNFYPGIFSALCHYSLMLRNRDKVKIPFLSVLSKTYKILITNEV